AFTITTSIHPGGPGTTARPLAGISDPLTMRIAEHENTYKVGVMTSENTRSCFSSEGLGGE
ncbi:hypothetical protein ACFVV7_14800, partial [Streptomyces globisporus]|uniref:hypothetical protein n=1 Tax=Streptomyces globisporus TaxID=1908 RepID=UPI0036DB07F6